MSGDPYEQFDVSKIEFGELDVEDDYLCFKCIEKEAWKIEENPIVCIIKNYFNEYLAAKYNGPNDVIAVFLEAENDNQGSQEEKVFSIEKYKTTDPLQWFSVAFTVSVNGEQYHLCCTSEKEIIFKPGKSPRAIRGDKSDVIFFTKQFSMGHAGFKFESSLHKDHFLAIKQVDGKRLLYLKKSISEVDESTRFNIHNR